MNLTEPAIRIGVDPTSRVAAMLRLASHFSYTTANDLALAGYDVLGYAELPAWLRPPRLPVVPGEC